MSIKIQVIFYSMYGHVYRMAEAVAEGAKQVLGAEVSLYQVPELTPDDVLEKHGAKAARASFAKVPVATVDQLAEAHAIIFGTPIRFGNIRAQMRHFLDQTGRLWLSGSHIGKIGSVFASTGTQHGGEESRPLPGRACRRNRHPALPPAVGQESVIRPVPCAHSLGKTIPPCAWYFPFLSL